MGNSARHPEKRPKGLMLKPNGYYYYRKRIPVDLLGVYGGRVEYVVSLKTKDLETARLRWTALDAKTQTTWAQIRNERAQVVCAKPDLARDSAHELVGLGWALIKRFTAQVISSNAAHLVASNCGSGCAEGCAKKEKKERKIAA